MQTLHTKYIQPLFSISDWIRSKLHIGSYEIIDFKDFKALQPAKDYEHVNETYTKVGHFTVLKSFPSTSCCSLKFPPNNLLKMTGWTCEVLSGFFSLGGWWEMDWWEKVNSSKLW